MTDTSAHRVSGLDRAIRAIWMVGMLADMALLAAAGRFPHIVPYAFGGLFGLLAMLLAGRTIFFAQSRQAPGEPDSHIGWITLALASSGSAFLFWAGASP